ncbi:MAG TPA: 2-C-methyl-D-erythritol 4-phosphate cytidylyltransferase [Candidatus Krumholzibacteria bacterium]|jgi:2-C-methyl-D-erythritol 4-phosphate cytidylyltransferase
MNTLAILVAAGRGERMGAGRPKAFLTLAGETLLLRSARAFERASTVDAVIAVVPAGNEDAAREELASISKLFRVTAGGARRQDSVRAGLGCAPKGFDGVVLVHDAARPLVDTTLIEGVCAAAWDCGAALPVLEMVDTIKRVTDGCVVETLDRSALAAAQTPQGFRFSVLENACAAAERAGLALTDESMAVERLGQRVVALAGSATNRKLTTPEDLAWAEAFLREVHA